MKKLLKRLLGMFLIILSISIVGGLIHNEKVTPVYNKDGFYIGDKVKRDTFTEGFSKTFVGVTIMATLGSIFVSGLYLMIDDKW